MPIMKIGFFTDSYLPVEHGVEVSIETFRKDLEKTGHQIFIYAPHTPGYKDKNKNVFRLKSIKVIKKPEMRFALPIVQNGELKKLIDFKLDVAHAHTPFSLGLLGKFISARQKILFVYTHHTDYPEYSKAYFKGKKILPKAAELYSGWFSNMADAVIAPSFKIKKVLKNYGVKKPIYILPTGVDLKLFGKNVKSLKAAKSLRKKLGIDAKEKLLIFVGRLGQEKNVDFLIRAFAKISKKRKGVKFLIAGEGPFSEQYKSMAENLGLNNTIFAGAVPHEKLPAYYQAADLFVFASLTETQGIVILEAMASGLPIAALKDDAFKGIVSDGENGFLIPPKSAPEIFAEKITRILDNGALRKKFSQASAEIAENFSKEKQAEKLLDIYGKLIKK